ncbi:hypothetical protein [Leptolyngbya sp. AN10]|uniref:hypothetical protein n=1 Tax=Leptolyngbya sp. AN10 TaxID=3423365 RepID=UPI003D30F6D0
MQKPRGNPSWTEKWGEPTKAVRLPKSVADAATSELQKGTPLAEVAERATRQTKIVQLPQSLADILKERLDEERENPLTLTLIQAIASAMRMKNSPLSIAEIGATIAEKKLYSFASETPALEQIQNKLNRHCRNIQPAPVIVEYFTVIQDSDKPRYWLSDELLNPSLKVLQHQTESLRPNVEALKKEKIELLKHQAATQQAYTEKFTEQVCQYLAKLPPEQFSPVAIAILKLFGFDRIDRHGRESLRGVSNCTKFPLIHPRSSFWVRQNTNPLTTAEVHEFREWINSHSSPWGILITLGSADKAVKSVATNPNATGVVIVDRAALGTALIDNNIGILTELESGIQTYEFDWELINSEGSTNYDLDVNHQ